MKQIKLQLEAKKYGYHLITQDLMDIIGDLPEQGLVNIFLQHTSAGICINENADPDVRHDFELYMARMVPENISGMLHTFEGADDMPAHIKSSIIGQSLNIPIVNGQLGLGMWQGIYLCEFRRNAGRRNIIITVIGD